MAIYVGKAVAYALLNDSGVSAAFGSRITPADKEGKPTGLLENNCIIFSRASLTATLNIGLERQVESEAWQIDIYSNSYEEAQEQSKAIVDLFHGFQGAIDSQQFELVQFDGLNDSVDNEGDLHRVSLTFKFFYNQS